jgi:Protein of unknown function (DUF3309)
MQDRLRGTLQNLLSGDVKACSGKRSGCKAGGIHQPSIKDGVRKEDEMLGTVLLIIVILMLVGTLPTWPHSSTWGYYPSGGLGLILLIVLILLLTGRL